MSAEELISNKIWPMAELHPVERPRDTAEHFGCQTSFNDVYEYRDQNNMRTRESLQPRLNPPPGFNRVDVKSPFGSVPPYLNYKDFGHHGKSHLIKSLPVHLFLAPRNPCPVMEIVIQDLVAAKIPEIQDLVVCRKPSEASVAKYRTLLMLFRTMTSQINRRQTAPLQRKTGLVGIPYHTGDSYNISIAI